MSTTNDEGAGYKPAPRTARNVSAYSALLTRLADEHARSADSSGSASPATQEAEEALPKSTTMLEVERAEEAATPAATFTRGDLLRAAVQGGAWRDFARVCVVHDDGSSVDDVDEVPSDVLAEAIGFFSASATRLTRAFLS